jgi:hypothetical protein
VNPHTGDLIELRRDEDPPEGFERLPRALEQLALRKLTAAAEDHPRTAQVNLRSRSPLALWAKKKRKAQIAAASRRRSRK